MKNLGTRFFGLELSSPVIAASSSLTGNLEQVKRIAKAGAGAVVLKSIFEEEIFLMLQDELSRPQELTSDPEYLDYFDYVIKEDRLNKQTELIRKVKSEVTIPVVASIHCISSLEWTTYAKRLQEAGADAIELNLFIIPSDPDRTNEQNEQFYFETIRKVTEKVTIPVTVKISHYFSNLASVINKISEMPVAGITLFNRFYTPDIDIERQEIVSASILSQPEEYLLPLRWIGMMSPGVKCPLAATTGIHSAETIIKFILAGAGAVQIASVLYEQGIDIIGKINQEISDWMDVKSYDSIDSFRGKLSINKKNATNYERFQFLNWRERKY